METNPGIVLQRMGVEVSPDDRRSTEEILHQLNRDRIAVNIVMEPDPVRRQAMAEFGRRAYPLPSDNE